MKEFSDATFWRPLLHLLPDGLVLPRGHVRRGSADAAIAPLEFEVTDARARLLLEYRQASGELPILGLELEVGVLSAKRDLVVDRLQATAGVGRGRSA